MSADVHDLNEARETGVVYASTWQMEEFKKRLESLNRKAIAYGLEPVKILNDVKRPFVRRVVDAGENAVASELVPWPMRPRRCHGISCEMQAHSPFRLVS